MDDVRQLVDRNQVDEALEILADLLDAAEEDGRRSQSDPSPAYASLTALLLQDRHEYAAAVAVLERYEQAVVAGGRSPVPRMAAELRLARRLEAEGPPLENTTNCPSCGASIDPPIKRSGKCKGCGAKIVARKHRGVTVLRTEAQQEAFVAAEEEADREEAIYVRANTIGVSDPEFDEHRHSLTKKGGREVSLGEVFWSLSQKKLQQVAVEPGAHRNLALVYQMMAEQLSDEGRDWTSPAREAIRHTLEDLAETYGPETMVGARGCGCGPCATNSESITLEQAQTQDTPPHAGCEEPPCACNIYLA